MLRSVAIVLLVLWGIAFWSPIAASNLIHMLLLTALVLLLIDLFRPFR